MPPEYGGAALSTPESSESRTESASSKRRRATIRVACNACRAKKTRCDGKRPMCGWCHSHTGSQCVYDTETASESRSAALRRENDILKRNLAHSEKLLQDLTSLPAGESIELLKRVRLVGYSVGSSFATTYGGYPEPFSPAESPAMGRALPRFDSLLDGQGMIHQAPLDHATSAIMGSPLPDDPPSLVHSGSSSDQSATPGFNQHFKRPSAEAVFLPPTVPHSSYQASLRTVVPSLPEPSILPRA